MKEPDLFFSAGLHDRQAAEYLNKTFQQAAERGAADIHILFESEETVVHYRLSGLLVEVDRIPNGFSKQIDEMLRARANISAAERHIPLDGRLRLCYPDRTIDARVSILPTISGQKIVCRLIDDSVSITSLEQIKMTKMVRQVFQEILVEPNGLFLVCGPTGSGKSTTLYAAINYLHDGSKNILTLEQPVEKIIKGITQVNINNHISFALGLRAMLRQDPDIALVGEIRDVETAMIAIQAANTGHLVLATVHANNSAMAVTRLLDMGVDPQTLADALRGVLSQRLVETISSDAALEWRSPTEAEVDWMERANIHHQGLKFPANITRDQYRGQMPVMEMIKSDAGVRSAILSMSGEIAVFNAAMRQPQFETMAQASVRLAMEGVTTLEKAMKLDRNEPQAPEVKRIGQILVELCYAEPKEVFSAAEQQAELRKQGKIRRIGQILVESGICTAQEIIEAVGYTEGAPDLIKYFISTQKVPVELAAKMEDRWRRERPGQSLFSFYIENNYLTEEDFNDPSLLHFNGRRVVIAAHHDLESGSAAGIQPTATTL